MKIKRVNYLKNSLIFKIILVYFTYLQKNPCTKINTYLYTSIYLTINIRYYFLIVQTAFFAVHLINSVLRKNYSMLTLSYDIRPSDRNDVSSVQRSESSLIGEI